MRLCLTEIHEEPFFGFSLDLEPGLHLALGQPSDGTDRLIEIVAGFKKPRQGRVEIEHQQPYYSPDLRAKIGSLLPETRLPAARTVAGYVAAILRIRAASADPLALLAEWQLESLGARSTQSLDHYESRSLALALALEIESPALLCLHQPYDTSLPRSRVAERIQTLAKAGAPVLIATNGPDLADLVPANVLVLSRGRLLRVARAATSSDLARGLVSTLVVVSGDARTLASALSGDARITAMTWNESTAPGTLRLWAPDLSGVCQAAVEAAIRARVELSYIGSEPCSLIDLQTAAYYEAISTMTHGVAQPPAPPA